MKQKHALPVSFFIVMILYNFATGFAHPVTPTLIVERQLPSQWYGYAMSAVSIGSFLIAPFWGKMCNYVSTKSLIVFGNLSYMIGQFIMCTAYNGPQLLIGRVLAGTLSAAATIGNLNYIMNIGSLENRPKYLTLYATAGSVCNAAGYFVGGWLGIISVEAAFIGQAIVLTAAAVLGFFVLESDKEYKVKPQGKLRVAEVNPFAAFADARAFMTKNLAIFFTALVVLGVGMSGFENSFNYCIKDYFHLGSQYNGTIKAIVASFGLLINTTIAIRIVRRTDVNKTVAWACGLITAFMMGAFVSMRSMILLSMFYILYSLTNFFYVTVCQNVMAKNSTPETSNSLMGFYQGMRSLGSVFGSFIQANLYAMGIIYSFSFALGMLVIGTLIMMVYALRHIQKQQRAF